MTENSKGSCGDRKGQTPTTERYPRVLMVLMTKVKAEDSVNLLIRNEFGGWPKASLAQVHSGETPGRGDFCGRYYRLGSDDRVFGRLFERCRAYVSGAVQMTPVGTSADEQTAGRLKRWTTPLKRRLGDLLIRSGFWEIIFRVRPSKALMNFVRDFDADLIYCQGYSLGFATLPLLISRRFGLPICFQTTDDWARATYRRSAVSWLLRRRARNLIRRATMRLALGDKMRLEYERRYGVPFHVTYHFDDPNRFVLDARPAKGLFRVVYTGSLGLRRYEAIQDLLSAIREVPQLAGRFAVDVHCSGLPKDMPEDLLQCPEVSFHTLPNHEQLPGVLAEATVLLLPESFNEARQSIEFSISTKAHLYMMSGRPILVYGPRHSGTVDYAIRDGWGSVVTERDPEKLKAAVLGILSGDATIRTQQRAEASIRRNHEMISGREKLRQLISTAARAGRAEDVA